MSKKTSKPTSSKRPTRKPAKAETPTPPAARKDKSKRAVKPAPKATKSEKANTAKMEAGQARARRVSAAKTSPATQEIASARSEAPPPLPKIPSNLAKAAQDKPAKRLRTTAPIAITLDEVLEIAKANAHRATDIVVRTGTNPAQAGKPVAIEPVQPPQERRVLASASLDDILGYNAGEGLREAEEKRVPEKFARYYKLLLELRDHVTEGLTRHAEDTLMKSAKEDSGDLSGYSQHMADAGTDTFDRDFALSLVANEQEALSEIDAAIKRIYNGTYGICELTGKPISRERLLAVPFARYSVEAQADVERTRRLRNSRGSFLADGEEEDAASAGEEDTDT